MTLAELKARPDFVTDLTPAQQAWVVAYIESSADKMAATKTAYPNTAETSLNTVANRCKRHPVIRRLLNDYYGRTDETGSKDALVALAWRKASEDTSGSDGKLQYQWATFYAKLKGFFAEKPEADGDEPDEWDEVRELESKGN